MVAHLHPYQLTLEPFHHPRLHLVRDFHVLELHVALYDLCLALCLIMADCSLFLTRLVFVCQVVLGSCLLIRNHHSRQTHPHHRASVHSPELASTTKPKLGSDTIATEAGYAFTTKQIAFHSNPALQSPPNRPGHLDWQRATTGLPSVQKELLPHWQPQLTALYVIIAAPGSTCDHLLSALYQGKHSVPAAVDRISSDSGLS